MAVSRPIAGFGMLLAAGDQFRLAYLGNEKEIAQVGNARAGEVRQAEAHDRRVRILVAGGCIPQVAVRIGTELHHAERRVQVRDTCCPRLWCRPSGGRSQPDGALLALTHGERCGLRNKAEELEGKKNSQTDSHGGLILSRVGRAPRGPTIADLDLCVGLAALGPPYPSAGKCRDVNYFNVATYSFHKSSTVLPV